MYLLRRVARYRLNLTRADESAEAALDLGEGPRTYHLWTPSRDRSTVTVFDWSRELFEELETLREGCDGGEAAARVGERLARFVGPVVQRDLERLLSDTHESAIATLEICANAAEIYLLPWELIPIGQVTHAGACSKLLIRYEWPDTESAPRCAPSADRLPSRIVLAWSASVGKIDLRAHRTAITEALGAARVRVDFEVLDNASFASLRASLERTRDAGQEVAVLHLLAQGGCVDGTFGIWFDCDDSHGGRELMGPDRVAQLLEEFAGIVRLVVITACYGGDAGPVGRRLGSVAQRLHRCGFAVVIASRFALSWEGGDALARALYNSLLRGQSTLEEAFLAARRALADLPTSDWASLQLYARAAGGDHTRVFRTGPVEYPKVDDAVAVLRRWDRIATREASLVTTLRGDEGDDNVEIDQVYVHREELEAALWVRLTATTEAKALLVVGEAGHGKTSLLQAVRRRVEREIANVEALFLQAPRLDERVTAEWLARALEALRSRGKRAILFLDTLDAVAADATRREHLQELIEVALEQGASVVACCRPQERRFVAAQFSAPFALGRLSSSEVAEAIRRHALRFTRHRSGGPDEQTARILEAIERDLPIRSVCEIPLTLRMLFEIYAPYEVAVEEMNTPALYQRYWERRVMTDTRGGHSSPLDSTDLSPTAIALANMMLVKGRHELSLAEAQAALKDFGGRAEHLSALVGRGVVHSVEGVRFFHQTFFEHAAGRGVCRAGSGLLRQLARHCVETQDAFRVRALEEALLLAEREADALRTESRAVLRSLLAGDLMAVQAGVRVFCLLERAGEGDADLVKRRVESNLHGEVDMVLREAPNVRPARHREVLSVLLVVWNRGAWTARQGVLDVFARLAFSIPDEVAEALREVDAVGAVLDLGSNIPGDRSLLRVLVPLSARRPDLVRTDLLRLFARDIPGVRVAVLDLLSEHAERFEAASIASRFFGDAGAALWAGRGDARGHQVEYVAMGRLWARQWLTSGATIHEICIAIDAERSEGMRFARLNGLAEVVLRGASGDVDEVAAHFLGVGARAGLPPRRHDWVGPLWIRLIEGDVTLRLPRAASFGAVVRRAREIVGAWNLEPDHQGPGRDLARRMLAVHLDVESTRAFLSESRMLPDASWTGDVTLTYLLLRAAAVGDPAARRLFDGLVERPDLDEDVAGRMSACARELQADGLPVADILVRLAVRRGTTSSLHGLLEGALKSEAPRAGDAPLVEAVRVFAGALGEIRARCIASPKSRDRVEGYVLWSALASWCGDRPSDDACRALLRDEGQALVRAKILRLMQHTRDGASTGGADLSSREASESVEYLHGLIVALAEALSHAAATRERDELSEARETLFARAMRSRVGIEHGDALVEAALAMPTDARKVQLLVRWLSLRLSSGQRLEVLELIVRTLTHRSFERLGPSSLNASTTHLRGIVRSLIEALGEPAWSRLLPLVRGMPFVRARVVIDALSEAALRDGRALVVELIDDVEHVVPEARQLLRHRLGRVERDDGVVEWRAPYDHLSDAAR